MMQTMFYRQTHCPITLCLEHQGEQQLSQNLDFTWPTTFVRDDAIAIEYVIGYGDTFRDVPSTVRHALFMLVSHYYENRENELIGTISKTLPFGFEALIDSERNTLVWLGRGYLEIVPHFNVWLRQLTTMETLQLKAGQTYSLETLRLLSELEAIDDTFGTLQDVSIARIKVRSDTEVKTITTDDRDCCDEV